MVINGCYKGMIRATAGSYDEVVFMHCLREGNRVAD